jgi:hypothetical protein
MTVRGDGRAAGPRWSRRGFLGLGLGTVALVGSTRPPTAAAASVAVGRLGFEVPAAVQRVDRVPGVGPGWEWQGADRDAGPTPGTVVLARADLASNDAEEVLGLLLAGVLVGQLPGLVAESRRERAMPGGGSQSRVDLSYQADARTRLHGTVLVAVRAEPPAAVLAVLGGPALTAGEIATVLDSARWLG